MYTVSDGSLDSGHQQFLKHY